MEATCIRKVAAVLAVLSSFFNINSSAQVPAFPGADGYDVTRRAAAAARCTT